MSSHFDIFAWLDSIVPRGFDAVVDLPAIVVTPSPNHSPSQANDTEDERRLRNAEVN